VAVAVLGYASADHCVAVRALPAPDTTAIADRLSRPWPRLGGCGPQIAMRLARLDVPASCLTWVAPDAQGTAMLAQLQASGAGTDGVVVSGTRTAESYIAYDRFGRSVCFYDPGDAHGDGLTGAQHNAVAHASAVCLTVAPAAASEAALEAAAVDATVVWSVKADRAAYPPGLVARLLDRADVVACAEGEQSFLTRQAAGREPREDALVLQTLGARGVAWRRGEQSGDVAVRPIRVADTTGAGDAFVAGVIAQLMRDPDDAPAAVAAGIDSSRALLEERGGTEAMA
jgi:sugar/nucleoside kinase (ribokinase family)